MPTPLRLFPVLLLLAVSLPAGAVDGAIEINQARALAGGVTTSDAPGFPVSLLQSGSYVLTGNLTVPDANTNAIEVFADNATIDFAGFGIYGPAFCVENAGAVSCSNGGTGVGVLATTFPNEADGTVVKNGTISGMGDYGVRLLQRSHVDNMLIENCYGSPIQIEDDSLVTDSRILLSGGVGIYVPSGVVNIQGNRIAKIGGATHLGATATGGNTCDDLRCSPVLKRLFYLTTTPVDGANVLTTCDNGFHPATLHEIFDPSDLQYDWTRGYTGSDSGVGPRADVLGWVRTGRLNTNSTSIGRANCIGWNNGTSNEVGSTVKLTESWTNASDYVSPWTPSTTSCDQDTRVWCVQD